MKTVKSPPKHKNEEDMALSILGKGHLVTGWDWKQEGSVPWMDTSGDQVPWGTPYNLSPNDHRKAAYGFPVTNTFELIGTLAITDSTNSEYTVVGVNVLSSEWAAFQFRRRMWSWNPDTSCDQGFLHCPSGGSWSRPRLLVQGGVAQNLRADTWVPSRCVWPLWRWLGYILTLFPHFFGSLFQHK